MCVYEYNSVYNKLLHAWYLVWNQAIPQEMKMPSETDRPLVLYINIHLPAIADSRMKNALMCVLKQSFDFVFSDNPCYKEPFQQ